MGELPRLTTEFDEINHRETFGDGHDSFAGIVHDTTISPDNTLATSHHPEAVTDAPEPDAITVLVDMMQRSGELPTDARAIGSFVIQGQRE